MVGGHCPLQPLLELRRPPLELLSELWQGCRSSGGGLGLVTTMGEKEAIMFEKCIINLYKIDVLVMHKL